MRTVEGFDDVAKVIVDYYQGLLGEQPIVREQVDLNVTQIGAVLIVKQQFLLTAPFSDLEIKEAIWSIPSIKFSGPDGFSSNFFKKAWNIISPQVCAAIQDFFQDRQNGIQMQ